MKTQISHNIQVIEVNICAVVGLALGILSVYPYKSCSWGPRQAEVLIATDGSWHNPIQVKEKK